METPSNQQLPLLTPDDRPMLNPDDRPMLVTQCNRLIESSYQLTLEEKRLIIAAISKIDSRNAVPEAIVINAIEYASMFGINPDAAYRQLIDASARLFEREITNLASPDGVKRRTRWIYDEEVYQPGKGRVVLRFSPNLHPYLGMLRQEFSTYRISNIKTLKSVYSIRLYELLVQHHQFGQRWFDIERFRSIMGLEDKYPRYADLYKWVIKPAINELNSKTDYHVDFSVERTGRRVTRLWFSFYEKKDDEKK